MTDGEIKSMFESDTIGRIIPSNNDKCNINTLISRVEKWKKEGYKIVFTAGVFDIFTINHLLALYHYKSFGGEKCKFIVSIDTDKRVSNTKSKTINGEILSKPVISWNNRALMIAKQYYFSKEPLVDLIVQHGYDTCSGQKCPHDDNVFITKKILPDFVVVTSKSEDTINGIKSDPKLTDKLIIIDEDKLAYKDSLLGGEISTSSIIQRARL